MKIFRGSWSTFSDVEPSVVTVGSFDGVHLGHRDVLSRLSGAARDLQMRSVVITFETHPRDVVDTIDHPVPLLTTTEEKLELLAGSGIDLAMVLQFDHSMGNLTAQDFVKVILAGRVGMKKIVVGFNHAFGKGRSGDRESLVALSRELGFTVEVVNPIHLDDDTIISSTRIRKMIADGDMLTAAKGLGRCYELSGTVIHGFGRGKRLGFPTANLGLIQSNKLAPKDGIYAGYAYDKEVAFPAAISIGYSPTFGEGKHSLEAHLIGFDGDLYDRKLSLKFIERIRGEEKYGSEAELIDHIRQDIVVITERLKRHEPLQPVSK
jgi:riboflavin kinase/FMN adenylyltransferase